MGLRMSYASNFIERLVLYVHNNPDRIYKVKSDLMIHISQFQEDGFIRITNNKIKMMTDIEKEQITLVEDKELIKQLKLTVGGILWQKEQEYREDQKVLQTQK